MNYFKNERELNMNEVRRGLDKIYNKYSKLNNVERIIFESGRYVLAEAGFFVTKVLYTKEVEEKKSWGKRSKLLSLPQAQQVKMVISQPTTFEQSEGICDLLKEKKSVIVNLEYVNKDIARRIIDVVSGAVHALDGHMQKVSNSIFLIAPYNYDITTEMAREEIKNKLSVSWLKNNMPND